MKKLCLSLFLTTIISISCMEKEQYYQYNNPQPIIIPDYVLTTSYQSNMQQFSQPGYCEANEPGWEFYDDIANMSYNHNQSFAVQPSPMIEIPLTPIYKPANSNTTQKNKKTSTTLIKKDIQTGREFFLKNPDIHATLDQTYKQWLLNGNGPEAIEVIVNQKDKEWLFGTNSLQPEQAVTQAVTIMDALYDQASIFAYPHRYNTTYCAQKREHEQCTQIIKAMNNSKKNGINEDLMGEFAYAKNCEEYTPIIFMLLKKYNATIQKTGEQLPSFYSKQLCLKEILNVSTPTNTQNITTHTTNTCDMITQYPAFFQFIYTTREVAQSQLPYYSITTLMTYLYKNKNILLEDYSDGSYKDFKSEFYAKTYDMFQAFLRESGVNCYNLVQMIDKAKEMGDIHNEDDLIAHMACYAAPQSLGTEIKSFFNSSHIDTERKRIVLFCKLVKIYNNKRGFKMTPTMNQYHAYCAKKALGISLPESLNNRDLFDENSYAFEKIAELKDATNQLKKANTDEINNYF